ncbi:MAG: tellurite resistance TerB family protein [Elusimicrobiota bacterium]
MPKHGLAGVKNEADALMVLAICAMTMDGKLAPRKMFCLRMLAYQSPLYDNADSVDDYVLALYKVVSKNGLEAVVDRAVALLPARMRETAYAWAADVVHADGKVMPSEHSFLGLLRARLGIHGKLAGKLAAASAIRHRSR